VLGGAALLALICGGILVLFFRGADRAVQQAEDRAAAAKVAAAAEATKDRGLAKPAANPGEAIDLIGKEIEGELVVRLKQARKGKT
jgi:hypothetical protein